MGTRVRALKYSSEGPREEEIKYKINCRLYYKYRFDDTNWYDMYSVLAHPVVIIQTQYLVYMHERTFRLVRLRNPTPIILPIIPVQFQSLPFLFTGIHQRWPLSFGVFSIERKAATRHQAYPALVTS